MIRDWFCGHVNEACLWRNCVHPENDIQLPIQIGQRRLSEASRIGIIRRIYMKMVAPG